jgi:CHASE3 domain sensor protein
MTGSRTRPVRPPLLSEQLDRLSSLEAALQRKLDELDNTIELRRRLGFNAARMAVIQADGKVSMDRIRTVISQMTATEKALLSNRTCRVAYHERNIFLFLIVGAGGSVAARIVIAFASRRRRTREETPQTDSQATDPPAPELR